MDNRPNYPDKGFGYVMGTLLFVSFAVGVTLCLMHAPGTSDVLYFIQQVKLMGGDGPFLGYRRITIDLPELGQAYPPLSLLAMWLSLHIGSAAGLSDVVSYKLVLALFSVCSPLLLLIIDKSANWATILFLIGSPFGLLLGYYDVVYLPFLMFALRQAMDDRWKLAGANLMIASLIKWQPVILGPLFLVGLIRSSGAPKQFIGLVVPAVFIAACVLAAFGLPPIWEAFLRVTRNGFVSGQGFNVGWLLSYLLQATGSGGYRLAPDGSVIAIYTTDLHTGVASLKLILRAIFFAILTASLVIYILGPADRGSFIACAFVCSLAQFTWNTGVHENHLFVPVIIALVGCGIGIPPIYLTVTAGLGTFNMLAFYGFGQGFNSTRVFIIDGTVLLSVCSVLLFFGAATLQIKASLRRRTACEAEAGSG
jgi:hypothetical protein